MNKSVLFLLAPLSLALGSAALALTYRSVDITLKHEVGPLEVAVSSSVSPALGVAQPPVKNGVAYVSASREAGSWQVGLSPKLPLKLHVIHETGSSLLNLTGLPMTGLSVKSDAGPLVLQLPSTSFSGVVTQDTGSLDIYLRQDTGLKLTVQKFETGSLRLDGREIASGTNLTGTYQSANYDRAKFKVILVLGHGAGPVEVFSPGMKP